MKNEDLAALLLLLLLFPSFSFVVMGLRLL